MKFHALPLEGAYLVELDKIGDDRGFFARVFCDEEFAKKGLESNFGQANNSFNAEKGTLRGLHYQLAPKQETKLIRCIQGALYDVILDIRPQSPTFGQWYGITLSAENRTMMYAPKGFAHGFLTLEPNTELLYFVSEKYSPEHERGIQWNDPRFKVEWPNTPQVLSKRDLSHPSFDSKFHLGEE